MKGLESIADTGSEKAGTLQTHASLSRTVQNLLAAGTILSLSACGGPCGDPEVFKLRPTTMAYFGVFQVGSHWTYQCAEDTSVMDTLTLHDRRYQMEELDPASRRCKPDHAEEISYQIIGRSQTDTLSVWLSSRRTDAFSMRGTFLGSALLLDGYIEGDPGSFVVREDRNDEIVFHESMVIGGHLYEDVVQLRKPWETSIPEQVPTFWIARGIGIVQFEQYDEALGNRRTFRLKE